jgi:prephenate dehydrogenase
MRMTIGIIGTGMMGGSFAWLISEKQRGWNIIGYDNSAENAEKAIEIGFIDESVSLSELAKRSDLIIITIPVNHIVRLLPQVLDMISNKQVVMDIGSTKEQIVNAVKDHPRRKRFVATHPMWGTEYSGPENAVKGAFKGRVAVICNKNESDADAVEMAESIYDLVPMQKVYMEAHEHDIHAAYVSHISHIASYALALTVLEKEREEDKIFLLAGGGFESTVRLAKSNPAMWVPIFMQNKENVLDVLNEHISQLRKFKACLEKENFEYLQELIEGANKIKKIIK